MGYLLQHLLADSAARAPERPAVADGGRVLSFAELDVLSSRAAGALPRTSTGKIDRAGLAEHRR